MILTRALARPTLAAAGLVCLASFALAGCADTTDGTSSRPADTTSATAASTPAQGKTKGTASAGPTTPSTSASSSAPPATDTASPGGGQTGTLTDRLLGADEVPGFNEQFRWTAGPTTTREPRRPFGTCQRFDMTSIGATDVALRSYLPAAGASSTDRAGELVAEFPDSTTARRAFAVLKSWRASCADRLKRYDRPHVGALEDVAVDGGTAGWYMLTYAPVPGDPNAQYFDAQGMAVVGSRIAMVQMILAGQDYNYPSGQEPMVAALQRAAAKLS